MTNYDLIIIGAGAAGIMAAISAKTHHPEFKILIIDQTFALGRKILVCGAGRCNLTNINLSKNVGEYEGIDFPEVIKNHYYGANPEFVYKIFEQFGYDEIIKFFENLGVEVYIERKTNIGKVFPITDSAKTISLVLEEELIKLGIEVKLNTEVVKVNHSENFQIETRGVELSERQIKDLNLTNYSPEQNSQKFESKYIIFSTGGKTYPALGSNGTAYPLLQNFNHKIITPVPSALPLVSNNSLCKKLSGQKCDLIVTSFIGGEKIKTRYDDLMFTDYGLSGPSILNVSREISIELNRSVSKRNCKVIVNFLSDQNGNPRTLEDFKKRISKNLDSNLGFALVGILPNKIAFGLSDFLGNPNCKSILEDEILTEKIFNELSNFVFEITATRTWNEAEFTSGGVDTSEIITGTLESKMIKNMYFAGEVMDVDGDVGGYNLSWAWSTGWQAGKLG